MTGRKLALLLLTLTPGAAPAARIAIPPPVHVEPLAEGTHSRPVQLSKLAIKLTRGAPFGRARIGLLCIGGQPLVWKGRRGELSTEDFDDVFRDELKQIGYDVVSTSGDLFDSGENFKAEFLVGGTITQLAVDACLPNAGLGDTLSSKGTALLEVEWQIFDRIERTVVARVTTRKGFEQTKAQTGGIESIIFSAFAENVRALAASGELRKYAVGEKREAGLSRKPSSGLVPLRIALPPRSVGGLSAAVGGTVLILSGAGHGSGFLISRDGYFLTNQHVVGGAKYVKLRWSDGIEELGEVVRVDKGRDVALVKGEPRDRAPLRLLGVNPQVGADVFAIGAPFEAQLQNSVTRGVISARRIEDGYSFLQSDVSVNPGNSGGPLVDVHGDVAAIAVSGLRIGNAPLGINFFIPAHEALEFLALQPK